MPLNHDTDNSTLFSRFRNFPLVGSLFEDGKRKSVDNIPTHLDIPLDAIRRQLANEDWWAAHAEDEQDTPPLTPAISQKSIGKMPERPVTPEEEWYGLEYTLELSSRERRASETHSETSAGECSRSRDSWAALRPAYADEQSFLEWQDWRAYLDRKKAYDFFESSRMASDAYLQEIYNWDTFYWELHYYGTVSQPLKDDLRHAPADPYYPRRKKNFAWYLKRSRSFASLRELEPVPCLS